MTCVPEAIIKVKDKLVYHMVSEGVKAGIMGFGLIYKN